ncbi:NAD(P)H-dependent oxidoreductase [Paracoccus sp. SCSIO 75233]|uniref:NAD(P)H-dependent oxidoreductase n=1 Tax=Paracoccus sp. SCSIO 75233 TaxID=3017782 RepID=UPI0022F07D0C|nr:NAD(P)H-dependent oxidoreductase [Paracoccus sp. SCSIO 75233]WBU54515.1 NAD(P)H-dependent oxidoreductase [Paracoccus sp. SCSIO 75233]
MRVLLTDGHPDADRLSAHMLDIYQQALPESAEIHRRAIRDLTFNPDLSRGYEDIPEMEPDLVEILDQIEACDHLVLAFPLWWGGEPARMKGFWDRILLPGQAFQYHAKDLFWDRLLKGRSADVLVSMDTPPAYLKLAYFNPVGWRYRRQVLGFVGFAPIRLSYFGMVRRGGAEKNLEKWRARIRKLATSATSLKRGTKLT